MGVGFEFQSLDHSRRTLFQYKKRFTDWKVVRVRVRIRVVRTPTVCIRVPELVKRISVP
jgi:hypothetical protein